MNTVTCDTHAHTYTDLLLVQN